MHAVLAFLDAHLLVLSFSVIALYFVLNAIYQLVFSPLCDIPGPWYAAVSNVWLTTHVVRLQQCKTIHDLFERYGPVVRVGPNKVVFKDHLSAKAVYFNPKFDKSTYYKSLLTNENDHAMTTLSHGPHAARKKGYAPHYNPAHLALFQPELHEYTVELVEVLERISGKSALDCLHLFRQFMVDAVSVSSFGYHVGALAKWAIDAEDPLVTAIGDFPRGILRSAVPSWAWNLICRIPHKRLRLLCDSDKTMAEFVSGRVYENRAQMSNDSDKMPLVQRLLRHRMGASNDLMSERNIISEHMGHFVAACDTTSTTLAYLCWELTRRADISKKLQAELDAAMPNSKTIPDISVLQELPYLTAFIKEGLRVYSAVPSLLERVVPASSSKTASFPESFDLMGFELPAGTIVATQGWSMHRDPAVFPSPDTFLPDRWLDASPAELATMHQSMMPFGLGTRVCGGQNLAQMILRITVASLVRNFDMKAAAETTAKSMEICDSFVIFPAAMRCSLVFNPREQR
ncbi:cytochrome P450 [Amylostereum chailletii]|nr:cytochrome P450 [Amylostereum chailletii]